MCVWRERERERERDVNAHPHPHPHNRRTSHRLEEGGVAGERSSVGRLMRERCLVHKLRRVQVVMVLGEKHRIVAQRRAVCRVLRQRLLVQLLRLACVTSHLTHTCVCVCVCACVCMCVMNVFMHACRYVSISITCMDVSVQAHISWTCDHTSVRMHVHTQSYARPHIDTHRRGRSRSHTRAPKTPA